MSEDEIVEQTEVPVAPKRRGRPPNPLKAHREKLEADERAAKQAAREAAEALKPRIKAPAPARADSFEYVYDDDDDRLKIHPEMVPDGMEYQWITHSIYGQLQPQRRARFERKGWEPVPSSRHDGVFMPKGYQGEIEVDGLVLVERPKEFCDIFRAGDRRKAKEQVQIKESQLTGGGMEGVTGASHPRAVRSNRISKTYERIEVPEE